MRIFILLASLFTLSSCSENIYKRIGQLEDEGKCVEATSLTNEHLEGPTRLFGLGSIAFNCEKNEKKGIMLLNKAADQNFEPAFKKLIELGEATPAQIKKYEKIKNKREKEEAEKKARNIEKNARMSKALTRLSCNTAFGGTGCQPNSTRQTSNYRSAIMVNGVAMCPMDISLGRYSHSTRSGLNKICYYK